MNLTFVFHVVPNPYVSKPFQCIIMTIQIVVDSSYLLFIFAEACEPGGASLKVALLVDKIIELCAGRRQ